MVNFSLDSKYFTNISLFASTTNSYKKQIFSIIINETFRIDLPEVVAASFSTKVIQLLQTDPTATELHINISTKRNISDTVEKIRHSVVSRESVLVEDRELSIFGEFGLLIGNEDFVRPFNEFISKSSESLSRDNVLSVLSSKLKFGNSDISKEINFISSHFESMRTLESFISYSSDVDNIDTVESILQSSELKLDTEDSLLSFVICVCMHSHNNPSLFRLFEHVYVEYCSSELCTQFIAYINEAISTPGIHSLLQCIGRRFVQPKLPVFPPFVGGRHNKKHIERFVEINNEDPLNGILKREYQKGNTLIEPSSTFNNNYVVDKLFDENTNTYFCSQYKENSFIKASLKDEKAFILNSYTIRGWNSDKILQMQSWKVEGERSSDGKWILLDKHSNEPFERLQIRTFNISCKDKLKSVKLTQTGARPSGDHCLPISAFDIFGNLYELKQQ